ncbi:plasminogen-binding N-terminal domain-containing protein [Sulfurimonas sp.]|uniref:plasminogen-binding N-terminal domain-containing protein n=1 Tax=Sulfurimonas sp. TaxID=2022749 RepID=UPI0025FF9EA4|nr:plasminogen-binding N-terminal domain-containing protein [Sulfurimonas sp.]MBW6487715.1 plasminogen-binding N-terminal domain-containing protein [Sulfurimonas sp.]
MKKIFLFLFISLKLFGAVVEAPIKGINDDATEVTVEVEKIDVGVSGFIVHEISQGHTTILKNAVVKSFDEKSKIAKVAISEYDALNSGALPDGKWEVKVGDMAVLAFGYTRGLLIAPNEDIYYRVTKNSKLQWVHPDIFATLLSFNGHPTPIRSDFTQMSVESSVGLVFIYLDERVYTLDAKSFNILAITDAKLEQKETNLPFYTRVPRINANWWGDGSDELEEYEPYYYELMLIANPQNKELHEILKSGSKKLKELLEEFNSGGIKHNKQKVFKPFEVFKSSEEFNSGGIKNDKQKVFKPF